MNRWADLFGCPTNAARTIAEKGLLYDLLDQCDACAKQTDECFEPGYKCPMDNYDAILEWLLGEVER